MCRICVHHIQLWAVTMCKLLSQNKVANNIPPTIIENILCFSGRRLPRRERSGINGVSKGAISQVLRRICETSSFSQGLCGHLLKKITSREDHTLSVSWWGTGFFQDQDIVDMDTVSICLDVLSDIQLLLKGAFRPFATVQTETRRLVYLISLALIQFFTQDTEKGTVVDVIVFNRCHPGPWARLLASQRRLLRYLDNKGLRICLNYVVSCSAMILSNNIDNADGRFTELRFFAHDYEDFYQLEKYQSLTCW